MTEGNVAAFACGLLHRKADFHVARLHSPLCSGGLPPTIAAWNSSMTSLRGTGGTGTGSNDRD